ncbi:MAG: tryptophan-rich sensory protein [Methanoregula sp.]|jgi:tryptophan-rich sensory protein|nr:tryptophan-rich sensory protein [Methanoregula sp.]
MVKKTLGKIILLLLAIGICLLAGYIGSIFTIPAIPTWYAGLAKPDFSPPAWVFAPVWTVLYILMGISLFLLLRQGIKNKKVLFALVLFILQLILNTGWSYLFFGLQSTFLGFMGIIALWLVLLCTMIQEFRVTVAGGALLIPYFLWVTFATYLCYTVMMMNPVSYGLS